MRYSHTIFLRSWLVVLLLNNLLTIQYVHSGILKIEDLFVYLENKSKYANDKCLKKPNFKVAVDQIEAAIRGEDSSPLDVSQIFDIL